MWQELYGQRLDLALFNFIIVFKEPVIAIIALIFSFLIGWYC